MLMMFGLLLLQAGVFDIEIEEDLIEEVARIYGYNSIPNNAPLAHLRMREHKESDLDLSRIKTALVDADYQEAITYSFVDPKVQTLLHPEIEALVLPNPISVEMSAMRVSLLSGLLGAVLYNQNRQQNRVRLLKRDYVLFLMLMQNLAFAKSLFFLV